MAKTDKLTAPALPMITYQKPRHLDAEIVQINKYRGVPSPKIDAEWMKIGLGTQPIRLFDDDLKRLNKSDEPGRPLHRRPEEFGGGYLSMLEVFHLLHCLNALRKASYKEYYIQEWLDVGENAKRAHDGEMRHFQISPRELRLTHIRPLHRHVSRIHYVHG